jgi:hypothetical protein
VSAENPSLKFHLEVIDDEPAAVFEGPDDVVKTLFPRFLHHSPHFVPDILYEISLVERGAVESSGFETPLVDVLILPDRVTITSRLMRIGESSPSQVIISVTEAKLLLLEWGAAVLRWQTGKASS